MGKDKKQITFKEIFGEIFESFHHFYRMQYKNMIILLTIVPMLTGVLCFLMGNFVIIKSNISMIDFMRNILGDFITIMALFVSFTMGYLSIIITSNSDNVVQLKGTYSKIFTNKNNDFYSLYQILVTDITYAVIIEIIFLILCIIEKFLIICCNTLFAKILCSIDVAIFAHIVMILLVIIKNIYYSFWNPE